MKKYFFFDESPSYPGRYRIVLNSPELPFNPPVVGSYNVFAARVLGLSWCDYLRYCRDVYDADLIGKNCKYVMAYFPQNEHSNEILKLLNTRLDAILKNLQNN